MNARALLPPFPVGKYGQGAKQFYRGTDVELI